MSGICFKIVQQKHGREGDQGDKDKTKVAGC